MSFRSTVFLTFFAHAFWSLCIVVLRNYKNFLPPDHQYKVHVIVAMGYIFNLFFFVRVMLEHNRVGGNRTPHEPTCEAESASNALGANLQTAQSAGTPIMMLKPGG
jgi:hypothetical protein